MITYGKPAITGGSDRRMSRSAIQDQRATASGPRGGGERPQRSRAPRPKANYGGESTRERIVAEAIRLFAERGYRGTTVGDIESAAGLAPRAGGFYKHFGSKEEVLAYGIERHVAEIERLRAALDLMPLGDLRAELTLVARWSLAELRAEWPVMKIVQKDGDQFPELVRLVRERIIKSGHAVAAEVMELLLKENGVVVEDPRAVASVALASLVGRDIEEMMFHHQPGGLDEEEFVQAWVEVWLACARGMGADLAPAAEATASKTAR
jgi:AcrR family transcriptional regulator